jgi:hypothetical protein
MQQRDSIGLQLAGLTLRRLRGKQAAFEFEGPWRLLHALADLQSMVVFQHPTDFCLQA